MATMQPETRYARSGDVLRVSFTLQEDNQVTDVCLETGHIGIYVSSKCQREFAPRIAAWLEERDVPDQKPRKKKSTAAKKATTKASARSKLSQRPQKHAQRSGQ